MKYRPDHTSRLAVLVAIALVVLLGPVTAQAQTPPAGTVQRPVAAGPGTVIVPDHFLRSWDPVTIFFSSAVGNAAGTPEDHPENYLAMSPAHPGAFTWVDPKTLQFRPADPWPPLARFTWKVGARTTVLDTLMSAPLRSLPAAGATGLDPLENLSLVFAEPIDPADLARMVTVELRPLPGIGGREVRWLTAEDFVVKALERSGPAEQATYVLAFNTPVPLGTRAILHLRLSLDDDSSRSFAELSFATAEPFRVVSVGSSRTRFPVTPEGIRYPAEEALDAGSDRRVVVVEFSAPPREISPVEARNLVRFTPAVDGLSYRTAGRTLEIDGDFSWDTLYRLTLAPSPITDHNGRPLTIEGPSELSLFFPRKPSFLHLGAGEGVVERFGPKMVPVEGRGHDRFDLRIYPVDPLDRGFWPFPDERLSVDESQRPPGPGEAPPPFDEPRLVYTGELRERLTALGSPPVSALVDLPLRRSGSAASFGLDLTEHLASLAGPEAPGHYLVGLRPLDEGSERQWMRIQVTDLSLTTVEEAAAVRLVVTSLATGRPVSGARVAIEGPRWDSGTTRWATHVDGTTGADGSFTFEAFWCEGCSVARIVVDKEDDVLVLEASEPPDGFHDNTWSESYDTWLQWALNTERTNASRPRSVSHVFTERPVYRPEEPVHIKGYMRLRHRGRLEMLPLHDTYVVVDGPGELEWRLPVDLTDEGSFYQEFMADDRPTGTYSAHLEGRDSSGTMVTSRSVSFRLEAYRLPRFEVNFHADDRVPLDRAFDVVMTATYYAGGRVADRPVQWRVTQFPYTWQPGTRQGFFFSSDSRFSGQERFEATAALEREDRTDAEGSAVLELDPTLEPTAQPRTYVVEATVVGADDQTVTGTRRITALPPFILGLKMPRYVDKVAALEPEVIVLGTDDELLAGQQVTVRLLHRQWHSYLRASDFSDGQARYITDVVDEQVHETTISSAAEPVTVTLPISEAGVYVVELEAHDRIGRIQTVSVDLYAGGDDAVTWAKPASKTFVVKTDKDSYDPGETATFVLQSPFQNADALVVVETPDGNRYQWLPVRKGGATFELTVEDNWTPRLPVHFVLMRPRVKDSGPIPGSATDLGKPVTMASTAWIKVEPRSNRLEVELEHPERALPGRTVDVTIRLSDPDGHPLGGEVTLWLVDQAVLALGTEQRLDPLPDFITRVNSRITVRDTRHLPFGELPFAERPGGGEGEAGRGILDRATVRRNFQPVPFYDPRILVGPDGTRTVTVQLPDNLTNFKLRAKAVSGDGRFGFAIGHLAVRLPLIVQPALPRFVRPGDRFTAAAIGRVVEGEGGPGAAQIQVQGVALEDPATQELTWVPNQPRRLDFRVSVPTPQYDEEGRLTTTEALFRVGVERRSDGATDAFEVRLPIRDDRPAVTRRLIQDLVPDQAVELPPVEGEARPGTVRRSVLVSNQPALVRMAAGLSFLLDYPHGCTEQRVSRARAHLAMEKFRDALAIASSEADFKRSVDEVIAWIAQSVDGNGLVAYWPGSHGYVSLTAWCLQFLAEARDADFAVNDDLYGQLIRSLEQAMRSDYAFFIDGESFAERCWALLALTRAGRFNPSYAAELARNAQYLNLESTAQVLQSFVAADTGGRSTRDALVKQLWDGVVVRLYQGREVYGGLQRGEVARNGLILPSESRALAEVTRALARADDDTTQVQVLVDGLVRLGRGDGWGSTNANASALLALAEVMQAPAPDLPERHLEVRFGGPPQTLVLSSARPAVHLSSTRSGGGEVRLLTNEGPPVVLRAETRWIPAEDGSQVAAEARGFVVSRELLQVADDDGVPPRRTPLDSPGLVEHYTVGDVVEDHVQVVNAADVNYVAVVVPLAAGMEPLNPNLATAPPEARPAGRLTAAPSYAAFLDHHVAFYFDSLPRGTYDFYFRTRATVPGRFIQPPALAEMMYDEAVRGNGNGAMIEIEPAAE